jgi:hypothetical protein
VTREPTSPSTIEIAHTPGTAVDLRDRGAAAPRLHYAYAGAPKPYIHPLLTPSGLLLTNYEPHDHVWHRGLWFTIKFVNEENFWEEQAPFGTQETEPYPEVTALPDGSVAIRSALRWRRPGGDEAMREQRAVTWRRLEDAEVIDWETQLTALRDTLLDRTPYTTWGGYGGLTFRGTRGLDRTRFLTPDGEQERMRGERAPWCDLSGRLDGGPDRAAGVCFLDHPSNPRHPTPFYGHPPSVNFLNAAFLFHEPMRLAEGETLRMRLRVLVHDGFWDAGRAQAAFDEYVRS